MEKIAEVRALEVNISRAAEQAPRAIAECRAALWPEANQAALESSNAYVEQHGLPLARLPARYTGRFAVASQHPGCGALAAAVERPRNRRARLIPVLKSLKKPG